MKRTPKQWASYIREAQGASIYAIIQTGLRLDRAHQE
jgi:hypothetical protein